jgi:AmmeMemoRadiSam system protein B
MAEPRLPVAAGRFYPADPEKLGRVVDELLAAAHPPRLTGELRALVVPHAGHAYSGVAAAPAFALLPAGETLRVALLGPAHFARPAGLAVTTADAWLTPLGAVPVDQVLRRTAVAAGAVADDRPHLSDHALEVELPFLQRRLGERLAILPIAVGAAGVEETASVVAALAHDAIVLVSTDLSHYHAAATAARLDGRTAAAICALDETAVGDLDACGAGALRGLLLHARRAGWACTLLDLRNSGDSGGDRSCVVGYGSFAFSAPVGLPSRRGRATVEAVETRR